MRSLIAVGLVTLIVISFSNCTPGTPFGIDTTFGTEGKVTIDFNSGDDFGSALAISGDYIYLAGDADTGSNPDFALVRYTLDGAADTTFSGDGKVTTNMASNGEDYGYAVAVGTDGKIWVGGSSTYSSSTKMAVARYLTDGTLDTTFDTDGKWINVIGSVQDEVRGIALASDGKAYFVGSTMASSRDRAAIVRIFDSGTLDTTFASSGVATMTWATYDSVAEGAVFGDLGTLVVAGRGENSSNDFIITRLRTNGTLDTSFGILTIDAATVAQYGSTSTDNLAAIVKDSNGRYLLAGTSFHLATSSMVSFRVTNAGVIDTSYGTRGIAVATFTYKDTDNVVYDMEARGYAAVMASDSSLYVAGNVGDTPVSEMGLAQFDYDGSPGGVLSTDGRALISFSARQDEAMGIVVQTDGKLILGGNTFSTGTGWDFALTRINP